MGVIGVSVPRLEDKRYVTGRGLYVEDVRLPDMLHSAVFRSTYAHARILKVDVSKAVKLNGVKAVYTADDLGPLNGPLPPSVSPLPQYPVPYMRTHYALAKEKVRYVGEPIAFIVAENKYVAKDALDLIEVEYEPLPPVVDVEKAIQPDSPLVHDDVPNNIAAHHRIRVGGAAAVEGDLVINERFVINRGAGVSIETRGVVAHYDPSSGSLVVWDSTQAPIPIKNTLAKLFKIPDHRVRVVAPDVGGGFGPKIMLFYPEEILTTFASIKLGKPVKWVEERREYMTATNQQRIQVHYVTASFTRDGKLLHFRDRFLVDTGAYTPYGIMVPIITTGTMPGPYKIPVFEVEFMSVYTNKTIVSPVRGAGRPEAVYVMERIMDIAAEKLGLDRVEIRRRNLIQSQEFPYDTGIVYQDGGPVKYDSGNYVGLLDTLLKRIDYSSWQERKRMYRAEGRFVGLGLGLYVEGAGVGPYEMARVTVTSSGRIVVATGVGSQGQGHYTTLAQIVAEVLGADLNDIDVVVGDTAQMPWGIGTFASRSATIAGNAVYLAAMDVRKKAAEVAAQILEANPEDLEFGGGRVYVKGFPEKGLSLGELAVRAHPIRGLIKREPGLEATRFFSPSQSVFGAGAHAAEVEVDPETGKVRVLRYVIVHDCGAVINPLIVDGQIHGGLSNGIGAALYEEIIHDESGQPLAVTLADYLIPSAVEMPDKLELDYLETRSPLNPLGVKGVGEAGVIPVPAVIASAIQDAFDGKVIPRQSPLQPARLKTLLDESTARQNHDKYKIL
ncbi:MAG: xanthine dehydrogenase family protein molybdopterin-binding subunit [Candidatus Caldarchaeum sp.]|nr:xanthine dehydrogenase family protein molybdopterin-binding subunit [Candidatus Caldarchaeum sp.]